MITERLYYSVCCHGTFNFISESCLINSGTVPASISPKSIEFVIFVVQLHISDHSGPISSHGFLHMIA